VYNKTTSKSQVAENYNTRLSCEELPFIQFEEAFQSPDSSSWHYQQSKTKETITKGKKGI